METSWWSHSAESIKAAEAAHALTTGPVVVPPLHNDLLIRHLDGRDKTLQKGIHLTCWAEHLE